MKKRITYNDLQNGDKIYISEFLIEVINIKKERQFNNQKGIEDLYISFQGKNAEGFKCNKGLKSGYIYDGSFSAWHWVECDIEV